MAARDARPEPPDGRVGQRAERDADGLQDRDERPVMLARVADAALRPDALRRVARGRCAADVRRRGRRDIAGPPPAARIPAVDKALDKLSGKGPLEKAGERIDQAVDTLKKK